MKDNFRKNTLNGIGWSVGSQGLKLVLTLGITSILARLLLPEDYGLIAMVTVATGFLLVLKDFGFGAALVQKKNVESKEFDSVFWLNVVIGATLGTLVFLSAPLVAQFYDEPKLIPVTKFISISFLLNGLLMVPNNILLKNLRFKHLFFSDIISILLSGTTAVIFAYLGFGYWSLVAQNIALQTSTLVTVFIFSAWSPKFHFSKEVLNDLKSFSLPLIADQSINYWVRNIDYLLIGKFLGKSDLGYYSKAYALMLIPVRQLSGTISRVMFPSLSTIQDDLNRVKSAYLKISAVIALISFPLMTFLFFSAEEVILILFGANWKASIPIFKVLCLLGAAQSIGTLSGNIYLSQGKTKLMFKVGIFTRSFMIAGIVIGLFTGGLMGVVYGYTFASALMVLVELYFVGRVMQLSLSRILGNLLPYGLLSATVLFVLVITELFFKLENNILSLFVNLFIAFIVYISMLFLFRPSAFRELQAMLKQRIS